MKRYLTFNKVPIYLISKHNFLATVVIWIKKKQKKKIYYSNVHTVVSAFKNDFFLRILEDADIVYPDGWGPLLVLNSKKERVNAADFIDDIFKELNEQRTRIYFLGEKEEVIKKAVKNIRGKYKNLKFVGFHNGYFDSTENKAIIKEIKTKKPQLVLIGMGTPKQEEWVSDNYKNLPNAVYWCVGGLFSYIAGTKKRAHLWLRENSLEWLYRLFQEPGRLFYRYTIENIYFAWLYISSTFLFKKPTSKGGFSSLK